MIVTSREYCDASVVVVVVTTRCSGAAVNVLMRDAVGRLVDVVSMATNRRVVVAAPTRDVFHLVSPSPPPPPFLLFLLPF